MTQEATTTMGRFKQFPRAFWVINGIELLERGAYYTLNAFFTVFMLATFRDAGMTDAAAGALAGSLGALLFLLLYAVPLVAAALAEKYGYKSALIVCFALLLGGYGVMSTAGGVSGILAAVLLIGFGAGIFKPIAAALVSQTSSEENRNFAYTIYYGCINIGALLFPLGVGLIGLRYPDQLSTVAFLTAAGLTLVNLVLTLTVFRNIREPQRSKNILGALKALGDVFKNPSFLVLLVIYSGFWFMYAMSLTFLTAYMTDFGRMPSYFNVALLQSINPGVIIIAAPIIGALTTRFNSLALMVGGIALYAIGLLVLGWSSTSTLFVGGIVIFSIGELLTHPSYLSYVSKLAPPDKVSIYLGYGFIPIAVGLFFGASVGGALYGSVAVEQGLPARFWALMATMGFVTVAALLIYNQFMARAKDRAAGVIAPVGARRVRGFLAGPGAAALVLLLIPVLLVGSTLGGVVAPADNGIVPLDSTSLTVATLTHDDVTSEGQSTEYPFTFPAEALGAGRFVLKWTDESAGAGTSNAPDTFSIELTLPNGTVIKSDERADGTLELAYDAIPGDYVAKINMVNAGDPSVSFGPIAVPAAQDTGNAWSAEFSYQVAKA